MSISLNVVRCAVACCDSSRCSAMRLRRVDIFSRVSRPPRCGARCARARGLSRRRGGVGGCADAGAGRCGAAPPRALEDVGLAHDAAATGAGHAARDRRPARRARSAAGDARLLFGVAGDSRRRCRSGGGRRCSRAPEPVPPARLAVSGSCAGLVPARARRAALALSSISPSSVVHLHDVAFRRAAASSARPPHRRHLDRDLVRLELDQRVAGATPVALLLHPPRDGRFDDRLTERRHLDRDHSPDRSVETLRRHCDSRCSRAPLSLCTIRLPLNITVTTMRASDSRSPPTAGWTSSSSRRSSRFPSCGAPTDVRVRIRAAALNHLDLFVVRGLPGVTIDAAVDAGRGRHRHRRRRRQRRARRSHAGDRSMINPGISDRTCEYCRAGEQSLCAHSASSASICRARSPSTSSCRRRIVRSFPRPMSLRSSGRVHARDAHRVAHARHARARAAGRDGADLGDRRRRRDRGAADREAHRRARVGDVRRATRSSRARAQLGADETFNHARPTSRSAIRERTGKRGVDVVVDDVGEATWERRSARSASAAGS